MTESAKNDGSLCRITSTQIPWDPRQAKAKNYNASPGWKWRHEGGHRALFGVSRAPRFIPISGVKSKIKMRTLPPLSGKIASAKGAQMRRISKKTGNQAKL